MKFNIKLLIFTIGFIAPASLIAMQAKGLKRSHYEMQFSPDNSPMQQIIDVVKKTPKGGLIAMNGSFICHNKLIAALVAAKNTGVRLELCVDANNTQNKGLLEKLDASCVYATCGLHTKRFIAFDVDPGGNVDAVGKDNHGLVITGSENVSNMAGKHHEHSFISSAVDLVKKHYKDHLFNKSLCKQFNTSANKDDYIRPKVSKKRELPSSPQAVRLFNSQEYDLEKVKRARIAKPVPAGEKEYIFISSLGFDYQEVADALYDKVRNGSEVFLVVDQCVLQSARGLGQLNRLHAAGANIFVWQGASIGASSKKMNLLQHTKLLLRERRTLKSDKYSNALIVLSTGNLVQNSSDEINYDQVVPESADMAQDVREHFKKLMQASAPFASINQDELARHKEETKEKRRAAKRRKVEPEGIFSQMTTTAATISHVAGQVWTVAKPCMIGGATIGALVQLAVVGHVIKESITSYYYPETSWYEPALNFIMRR